MRRSVFLFCFILFYFFTHTFLVIFMKSLYSVIKHKMKQKERKKKGRRRKRRRKTHVQKKKKKKKKMPVGLPRISWAKICADFGLQAFVTFTQNSFFQYIWCYVFINSYSHNNFSRPVSCWLYCLVFKSIQNHTITCIQNCMEFHCPLYLPE